MDWHTPGVAHTWTGTHTWTSTHMDLHTAGLTAVDGEPSDRIARGYARRTATRRNLATAARGACSFSQRSVHRWWHGSARAARCGVHYLVGY